MARCVLHQGILCAGFARASGLPLADSVCAGKTASGSTSWIQLDPKVIYVDVDTSVCGFQSVPVYVTSLAGNSGHWKTTGSSEITDLTATGFRTYIRLTSGITPLEANANAWHVNWLADSLGATRPERGVCSGRTASSGWEQFIANAGVYVDADTSACSFGDTPAYVTGLAGEYPHYLTLGSSEIYRNTATELRVYLYYGQGIDTNLTSDLDFRIHWLADSGVCSGCTVPGNTNWVNAEGGGIYVDVNTSACAFQQTPVYVTSLSGTSAHWTMRGSSEVYSPTATGFRIYITHDSTTTANDRLYSVNWIARSVMVCTVTDGLAGSTHYPCACGSAVCEEGQLCLAPESRCKACAVGHELTSTGCQYALYSPSLDSGGPCMRVLGYSVSSAADATVKGYVYLLTVTLGTLPSEFFEAVTNDAWPSLESLRVQSNCTQGWAVTPGSSAINLTRGDLGSLCVFTTSQRAGKVVRRGSIGVYANSTDPDTGLEHAEKRWTIEVSLEFEAAALGVFSLSVSGTQNAGASFSSAVQSHKPEEGGDVLTQPYWLTIGDLWHAQRLSPAPAIELALIYLANSDGLSGSAATVQNITEQVSQGGEGDSEAQFIFVPGVVSVASCTPLLE